MVKVEEYEAEVSEIVWGPLDKYLGVSLIPVQLMEGDGWRVNDKVKVTITVEKLNDRNR